MVSNARINRDGLPNTQKKGAASENIETTETKKFERMQIRRREEEVRSLFTLTIRTFHPSFEFCQVVVPMMPGSDVHSINKSFCGRYSIRILGQQLMKEVN